MKKTIFCFFILINEIHGQVIPQCGDSSCWAACLAMISKTVDDYPKSQQFFIKMIKNTPNSDKVCGCDASTIDEKSYFKLVQENIIGYQHKSSNSMGLGYIKSLLNNKKPIIYNYTLDGTSSHIVVIDNFEHHNLGHANISLLKIKDPWIQCKGNEYFMTYERYYVQNQGTTGNDHSKKYTISHTTNCTTVQDGITELDKDYLNKILYDSTSSSIISKFLNSAYSLSNDFFTITHLDKTKLSISSIFQEFIISNVGERTFTTDTSFKISTLLNYESNFAEKISCIAQEGVVKTIISTSNKTMPSSYPFYNNWIIYHIEKGQVFEDMFYLARQGGFETKIIANNGVLFRFADTYFAILKKNNKYYIYDLYRDGFRKLTNDYEFKIGNTPSPNTVFLEESIFSQIFKQYIIRKNQ